jgi:hypothetical protein
MKSLRDAQRLACDVWNPATSVYLAVEVRKADQAAARDKRLRRVDRFSRKDEIFGSRRAIRRLHIYRPAVGRLVSGAGNLNSHALPRGAKSPFTAAHKGIL